MLASQRASQSPNLFAPPFTTNAILAYQGGPLWPLMGAIGYNDGSSYPDPAIDGGLGRRHGKTGGIVLALDGHVEFINGAMHLIPLQARTR